jgi:D-tyrosyl-tRNA(Tyr) deacylase
MIGLLQRVTHASVTINGDVVATINKGLLVLVGIEKNDSDQNAVRLLEKLIAYRVFADDQDKMNLSLKDINGELLLVPQFTLVADTQKGLRPSFSNPAPPEHSRKIFKFLIQHAREQYSNVQTGIFGADMQVNLTNDGPVTFWLQT